MKLFFQLWVTYAIIAFPLGMFLDEGTRHKTLGKGLGLSCLLGIPVCLLWMVWTL